MIKTVDGTLFQSQYIEGTDFQIKNAIDVHNSRYRQHYVLLRSKNSDILLLCMKLNK